MIDSQARDEVSASDRANVAKADASHMETPGKGLWILLSVILALVVVATAFAAMSWVTSMHAYELARDANTEARAALLGSVEAKGSASRANDRSEYAERNAKLAEAHAENTVTYLNRAGILVPMLNEGPFRQEVEE